jgi:hypothetical protein
MNCRVLRKKGEESMRGEVRRELLVFIIVNGIDKAIEWK